jgi:hypothetical protein
MPSARGNNQQVAGRPRAPTDDNAGVLGVLTALAQRHRASCDRAHGGARDPAGRLLQLLAPTGRTALRQAAGCGRAAEGVSQHPDTLADPRTILPSCGCLPCPP